jgi:hypothetical protein
MAGPDSVPGFSRQRLRGSYRDQRLFLAEILSGAGGVGTATVGSHEYGTAEKCEKTVHGVLPGGAYWKKCGFFPEKHR